MVWWDIPGESTRVASFLTGNLDTGVFNSDSILAIKDSPVEGLNSMVFSAAIIYMLWHEGGHYTPDSPHHRPNAAGYVPVPVDDFYGDYRNICHIRPWITCDREIGSEGWENARKVRLAMTLAIDRQELINNIAFGEGELWYIGIWANRGRMKQLGLNDLSWDYDPEHTMELLRKPATLTAS